MKILVVEDDISTQEYIKKGFVERGYTVDTSITSPDALFMASNYQYDLIILDRMIPQLDGINVLKAIRATESDVPIIILSALGDVDERIKGLKAGSDDYLAKPFSFSELLLRAEKLIQKSNQDNGPRHETVLKAHDLKMDLVAHKVSRMDKEITLQPKEYQLLRFLLENKNKVVSRTILFENVWDYHFDPQTNVIDVHVAKLRKKLEENNRSQLIHTVRGAGYVIRED